MSEIVLIVIGAFLGFSIASLLASCKIGSLERQCEKIKEEYVKLFWTRSEKAEGCPSDPSKRMPP